MHPIQTMFDRLKATRCAIIMSLALACAILPVRAADGNPPRSMTYQGYLTDGSGVPLGNAIPANYDMIFKIFDTSTDGSLKWAEKQTVTVDKGQFSVILGEGAVNGSDPRGPIDAVFSAPDASDRFVEVVVKIGGADVTIAPRLRLVTSPYAFLAKSANALVGANGAALMTSPGPDSLVINGQLRLTGGLVVNGNNVLEFGAGIVKEAQSGKIGYQTFSSSLDIVGAGTTSLNRSIKLWAEGGTTMTGNLAVQGSITTPKWNVSEPIEYGGVPMPRTGSFTSGGGKLVISVIGSCYVNQAATSATVEVLIDGASIGYLIHYFNLANVHTQFTRRFVVTHIPAGAHTVTLRLGPTLVGSGTPFNNAADLSQVIIEEFPIQ